MILLDSGLVFFVRGRFQGSYYCSNLKFCIRIYICKYNRDVQDSGHDDPYVMFTEFGLRLILQG